LRLEGGDKLACMWSLIIMIFMDISLALRAIPEPNMSQIKLDVKETHHLVN
jgi:hypothetical protein